jgi:ferredoxin-NADP reductase/CRP-like cAMP-binding protein
MVQGLAPIEVGAGAQVVAEGEPADACFVVLSGRLEVFTHAADGAEVPLAALEPGAHFGEQAMLRGDATRTASVRGAAPRSQLLRIGFDRLAEVFGHAPALRERLLALGERQFEERLARRTDLVRRLLASVEVAPVERSFENGHVLYRQGEPAASVYVILSGDVELFEERDGLNVHVGRIGPGLGVGLRDVGRRVHTAVVDGTTRLLEVSRDALAELTASSREAADHLATLETVWELPQRGLVTQYLGAVDGLPCVTQLFHLADGSSFVSSHVLGSDQVRLQATRGAVARRLATPDGAVRLGLQADGRIATIDAHGAPPLLAALFARAIEGRALRPAEESSLAASGAIAGAADGFACACLRVTRERIREVIAGGGATLDELKQRTGCAMACGSCVPGLLELLGETGFVPVVLARRQAYGKDVLRVSLAAAGGGRLPAARPGQHVVLRVDDDGELIERPYTLSGAAGGPWEITVKREPGGRFSRWLFERAKDGVTVEASRPNGSYVWDAGPAPVVCLTSGIGVTPALCFARTLLREGWPHRLVVDWSTRDPADAALIADLAASPVPNLTLRPRFTARDGRISAADVEAYARRFPSAVYFLCGSQGYMDAVAAMLRTAGVPAGRVRIESFDPASVGAAG